MVARSGSAEPPLQEAIECASCGVYFSRITNWTSYGGRYCQLSHTPKRLTARSGDMVSRRNYGHIPPIAGVL